jgi:hypothetical protein
MKFSQSQIEGAILILVIMLIAIALRLFLPS